ncbi:MAG: hypothetical protein NTZ98_16150 [Acidobacteria bacterium]|nr:hypothetical protein [Acidobacteriota bacterium]
MSAPAHRLRRFHRGRFAGRQHRRQQRDTSPNGQRHRRQPPIEMDRRRNQREPQAVDRAGHQGQRLVGQQPAHANSQRRAGQAQQNSLRQKQPHDAAAGRTDSP